MDKFNLSYKNRSDEFHGIGIAGPKSRDLFQKIVREDISNNKFKFRDSKRMYVAGESGKTVNLRRRSNDWYVKANKMSEQNCYNVVNPGYKSYTWEDVWK